MNMSVWRGFVHGLRALVRWGRSDRDLADEVAHYMEEARRELESRGVPPAEALRAVRLRYGDELAVREEVRSSGWEQVAASIATDLRVALRRALQSPLLTLVGVGTMAVGLGAAGAVLGVAEPLVVRPLPYAGAERVFTIADRSPDGGVMDVAFGTYVELSERARSFEGIAVFHGWQPALTGGTEPLQLDGLRVSAEYMRVLGVTPWLGSDMAEADDEPGGRAGVLLSYGLWQSGFGGDSSIIGRGVTLDERSYTVLGVMPPRFEDVLAPTAQVWTLLQYDRNVSGHDTREWGHHLRMVARLGRGIEPARALRELDGIARTPVPQYVRPAWASMEHGLVVRSLHDVVTGGVRPTLLALAGAVLLLLVIAAVNVTNIALTRSVARRGEFALRTALGAGRARLVRQLLTESAAHALIGGAIALGVATVLLRTFTAWAPATLARARTVELTPLVATMIVGAALVIGAVVGVVSFRGVAGGSSLQEGSPRVAGGHAATRRWLVVSQVAVAVVLLVTAGLLFRTMRHIFQTPPGFVAARTYALQLYAPPGRVQDGAAGSAFLAEVAAAVERVPGVASAALTSQLPLSGDRDRWGVHVEGSVSMPDEGGGTYRYSVTPGYFSTLGIPLVQGRLLTPADRAGSVRAVLISESLARRRFAGRDPLGARLHIGRSDLAPYTVVGVVGDVLQESLTAEWGDAVYVPPDQFHVLDRAMWVVVRVHGDAVTVLEAVRRAVRAVDPDVPIVHVRSMGDIVTASESQRRIAAAVFQGFAAFALLLAVLGVYGVVAAGVAERVREIGIRAALGATRARIMLLVFREGGGLVIAGTVIGSAAAALLTRALVSLLHGVSRYDPLTYGAVAAALLAAALLACCAPALRAAGIDPAETLRSG